MLKLRNKIYIPRSISKTTTLAPLLLAPNASALPAPPAPTSTNNLPLSGEESASPFMIPLTAKMTQSNYSSDIYELVEA